ncbi:hypothetical protein [Brachybacterium phenoliresistens]|uniref:hypothetical protein n=1 Tax=Brachybacterium phenoliresistens TaxID=396014 RepID=UPI0031D45474
MNAISREEAMNRCTRRTLLIAGPVMLTGVMSSCGPREEIGAGMSGSRATIYDSLDSMRANCDLVVKAIVDSYANGERTLLDGDTLSTTEVRVIVEDYSSPEPQGSDSELLPTSFPELIVIQHGSPDMQETPAPILELGKTYILFRNQTQPAGQDSEKFFIAGGDAGIYLQEVTLNLATEESFRSIGESGDNIPESATIDELFGR